MREINAKQVAVFSGLLVMIGAVAGVLSWLFSTMLPDNSAAPLIVLIAFGLFFYLSAFLVYRLFLRLMPLREGYQEVGSAAEFAAQVNILFYLLLFNSLVRTNAIPVPLMRLVYLALGARLGTNTYSAGAILDPPLTVIGRNCIIGHNAVLFAHAIEGQHFSLATVRIGDNVTVGAMAIVMSDVHIGDGAMVSAGAVVVKGTRIGAGEVWGGVPARLLRTPAGHA